MGNELISHCPRCSSELTAIRLVCRECDLELSGDFKFSRFDYLSVDEINFVLTFLKYEGNFRAVQEQLDMSYPVVKKKLAEITSKLGIGESSNDNEEVLNVDAVNFVQVEPYDSPVARRLKEKLNNCGGRATVTLLRGDSCDIWFDHNGKGLVSPKIPLQNQLTWEVFDAAVEVVLKNNGKAIKGNARSGAKLGSASLPLDSVEGYVAYKVHGVNEGDTAYGPGFVIAAVLDWAGVCVNERGFLSINPGFIGEFKK